MSTSCSSTSVESTHSASITVRSVFSCVASRKREAAGPRDEASRSPSGPNPLGENITLSSPPLKPRGLLLSVMRQKVGKERSQGVFAPLAIPPEWAANHQQRKFGLAPIPLEALQNPGWSAQRHRRGRRFCESLFSPPQAQPGTHHNGPDAPPTDRTAAGKPRSQIARPSAAPRGGRNFVAAPPATGPSPKKNLARRSLAARWVYFGRPAPEPSLPGEKTVFGRALAEIDQTTKSCLIDFLLQQSRAVA